MGGYEVDLADRAIQSLLTSSMLWKQTLMRIFYSKELSYPAKDHDRVEASNVV